MVSLFAFLSFSDSYEFSNGNLASCVLTETALPTHLGSTKKCIFRGLRTEACTMHEIGVSLWISKIFLWFVSCFVKKPFANNAKETYSKCQNKQLQLTHYVTNDWRPFHNISMASKQSRIEWWSTCLENTVRKWKLYKFKVYFKFTHQEAAYDSAYWCNTNVYDA